MTAHTDGFHIEAQWLCDAKLATGTIRVEPNGTAMILRETTVASGLGIWSWAYDGPFRVAVDLRH